MELYYFLSGIQLAVIAVLIYQYRYMLSSIKANITNIKNMKDGYDILKDNQHSITQKLAEDNYADAAQMNSNIAALVTKIEGTKSDLDSLINKVNHVESTAKNDKLEIIQNLNSALRQQTDQRGY
jgi:hypothetical protein